MSKDRIAELKELVDHYDHSYYNKDISEITDPEYDSLKAEYLALTGETEYDYVPGNVIGQDSKYKHSHLIQSLKKVSGPDDLREELIRLSPGIIEPKYDGLTIVEYPNMDGFVYENGIPMVVATPSNISFDAVTRGTGIAGDNVGDKLLRAENFDAVAFNRIKAPIRCEVFMPISAFKKLNENRIAQGETPYENPRNAAAGMLRADDGVGRFGLLKLIAYDIVGSRLSESQKLNMMFKAGIPTPPKSLCFKFDTSNIEEAVDWCVNFDRESLDYEIDGLVIKSNIEDSLNIFGATGHHPKNAVAFKFPSQGQWTTLLGVNWQVGRTGKLTPVGDVMPVKILGSTITNPTLHNIAYILAKQLMLGSDVFVIKANDVIPAITESRLAEGRLVRPIKEPTECPVCNGPVYKINDQMFCENPLCKAKLLFGTIHLGKKEALDIPGLAEGTVQKMIDAGILDTPTGLFVITEDDIRSLEGFADKSAKKLYNDIQSRKTVSLAGFIYAAGLPNVGRTASRLIAEEIGTYSTLMADIKAGAIRLSQVDGIGRKDGIQSAIVSSLIKYQALFGLLYVHVKPEDDLTKFTHLINSPTNQLSFVLTGKMSAPRADIEYRIKQQGHIIHDSIKSNTDYLVTGDNVGAVKTDAARKKGVTVITEDEMWDMI